MQLRAHLPHPSPTEVLDSAAVASHVALPGHLAGFGGAHGGLVAAFAAERGRSVLAEDGFDAPLRSVSCRFHRAITPTGSEVEFRTSVRRIGGRSGVVAVEVLQDGTVAADASVVCGRSTGSFRSIAAEPPAAGDPADHDVFTIPTDFVPFASFTEIRPVTDARPFAGGDDAELVAWIRLTDADRPLDPVRSVVLADALAPSYAAVLDTMAMVPTLELAVDLEPARPVDSPWGLLRATTVRASTDGWSSERLELWDGTGQLVATATQHRLARLVG